MTKCTWCPFCCIGLLQFTQTNADTHYIGFKILKVSLKPASTSALWEWSAMDVNLIHRQSIWPGLLLLSNVITFSCLLHNPCFIIVILGWFYSWIYKHSVNYIQVDKYYDAGYTFPTENKMCHVCHQVCFASCLKWWS